MKKPTKKIAQTPKTAVTVETKTEETIGGMMKKKSSKLTFGKQLKVLNQGAYACRGLTFCKKSANALKVFGISVILLIYHLVRLRFPCQIVVGLFGDSRSFSFHCCTIMPSTELNGYFKE